MNNFQIEWMMRVKPETSVRWKGFLAPDVKINNILNSEGLYFLNTAPSTSGGEHWCALNITNQSCEFFDSFGFSPEKYKLLDSFSHCCKKIKYNGKQVQSLFSKVCGHHCIFFCVLRANNVSCENILQKYSSNMSLNDDIVFNFVVDTFGIKAAQIN